MLALLPLSARLAAGQGLSADEVRAAALALAAPEVPDAEKAAFLTAFSDKGETAAEVAVPRPCDQPRDGDLGPAGD